MLKWWENSRAKVFLILNIVINLNPRNFSLCWIKIQLSFNNCSFKDSLNHAEKIFHKNIIARVNTFNNKCAYCGIDLEILDRSHQNSLEIDHVIPKKNNGSHCLANIVPSCRSCNQDKRSKNMIEWLLNEVEIFLFLFES